MAEKIEIHWRVNDMGIFSFDKPEGWDDMSLDDKESEINEMMDEILAEQVDTWCLHYSFHFEEVND